MKNREVLKLLQNLPENTKGYIDSKVPKKYAGSDTAGGVATEAAKLSNGLLIVCGVMQGGQRTQFNGTSAQTVIINPASIGAAYSDHDHNYAGSKTAGGTATEAAKTTGTLTIQTNGVSAITFNGSANKSLDITPASIGAATSDHTHSNYALVSHTHNYAGSKTSGGAATEAAKTTGTLTLQTNGTSAGTFNGSANKTVNITATNIGAAASNHTHSEYASVSHTHLYAGSATAGGVATEAAKTSGTLSIKTNGTNALTFNGNANKSLDITPAGIGAATANHTHSGYASASHTHPYAGSSTAGGVATEAAKTTGTLTIQTDGVNAGTFNGSSNKTVNITAASIGAAASDHTHSNYLTPSALNNYVTTSVLSNYASKNDLSNYASKNDLSNYATKADLGNIDDILDSINGVSL